MPTTIAPMIVKYPRPMPPAKASTTPSPEPTANAVRIARAAFCGRSVTRAERGMRAHSQHLMPTGAGTMQSGQIGFPQLEQRTPVSTLGWLAQVTGAATPVSALDTAASVASAPVCRTSDDQAPVRPPADDGRDRAGAHPLGAGRRAGDVDRGPRAPGRHRRRGRPRVRGT